MNWKVNIRNLTKLQWVGVVIGCGAFGGLLFWLEANGYYATLGIVSFLVVSAARWVLADRDFDRLEKARREKVNY